MTLLIAPNDPLIAPNDLLIALWPIYPVTYLPSNLFTQWPIYPVTYLCNIG